MFRGSEMIVAMLPIAALLPPLPVAGQSALQPCSEKDRAPWCSAVAGDRRFVWCPQRRSEVLGRNGMVATSQPLAAQAGLEILKRGGNAIDAAVATGAVLSVLEPMITGRA